MKTFFLQIKFAVTSSFATLVDYALYLVVVTYFFSPVISNVLSYATGIFVNFALQKRFIFMLRRKVSHAFLLSVSFSLVGLVLSTLMIAALTQSVYFLEHQYLTKLVATALIFFYNFYTKRFAFER